MHCGECVLALRMSCLAFGGRDSRISPNGPLWELFCFTKIRTYAKEYAVKARQTIKSALIALAAVAAIALQPAMAATYNFTVVENNSALDFGNQLRVEVAEVIGGASFTLFNDVGIQSSIAAIYFDDLTPRMFLDPIGISDQSSGVIFKKSSPPNMPGGNKISFEADDGNSVAGSVANGVNASGEWISFLGLWVNGNTSSFNNLISAMDSGAFRVGVHLRALPDGQSESYVTPSTVPLPAAAWLFGSALFGFMMVSNRRKV